MNKHSFCRHLLSVAWADFRITHPELRQRDFGTTENGIANQYWHVEGPNGFVWDVTACCAYAAKNDALPAYDAHLERVETTAAVDSMIATIPKVQTGWITEVCCSGEWSRNQLVWPDEHSAKQAGADLLSRWMVPTDYRATQVDEEPNRPTWDEDVAKKGLPPRSVQV